MVNIVNAGTLGGGFRHYSGLLPATPGSGDPHHASVRVFHIPAANTAATFRGDIVSWSGTSAGNAAAGSVAGGVVTGINGANTNTPNPGGADLPQNISAPSASVVIGNGGGTGLGNQSQAPNVNRWVPGDTASVIAGVVVGFGPITLYMAKNGFQYIPASTEAWVFVETDPSVEMYATVPTVPGSAFNTLLGAGADVKANAGFQSTRFGISGLSLDPATFAATNSLPLRILESGEQIGDDPTAAGFVAKVRFNSLRHAFGSGPMVTD